jgi:allantoate deiminase
MEQIALEFLHARSHKFKLVAIVIFSLLALTASPASSTSSELQVLPDAVLRHVLYIEPNLHIHRLGNVSDVQGSLKRTFLDGGHRRAASLIQRWMRAAGMTSWIDAVGNVRGRAASADPTAPAMFVGSHYDSVIDGGIFDGAMGIITGIAAVKALVLEAAVTSGAVSVDRLSTAIAELEAKGIAGEDSTLNIFSLLPPKGHAPLLRRPIEVAGFADEEGIRFQTTFLGSRALAGTLVDSGALNSKDSEGKTLLDALLEVGMEGTSEAMAAAALDPGAAAGYVEIHLEQGPVLEASGRSVGVVRGIAGQSRLLVTVKGEQGHAGTVPMRLRRDPMAGTAEVIFKLESICRKITENVSEGDDSLVCTVGALSIWPGAVNVIPGAISFTLDVRCQSDVVREHVLDQVKEQVSEICSKRKLGSTVELRHNVQAIPCSSELVGQLADAVEESAEQLLPRLHLPSTAEDLYALKTKKCAASASESDASTMIDSKTPQESCAAPIDFTLPTIKTSSGGEVPILASGAGHDAMAMSDITPIGMVFVRCRGGLSHSPEEWVEPEDVATGAAALLQFLYNWEMQSAQVNGTVMEHHVS